MIFKINILETIANSEIPNATFLSNKDFYKLKSLKNVGIVPLHPIKSPNGLILLILYFS